MPSAAAPHSTRSICKTVGVFARRRGARNDFNRIGSWLNALLIFFLSSVVSICTRSHVLEEVGKQHRDRVLFAHNDLPQAKRGIGKRLRRASRSRPLIAT